MKKTFSSQGFKLAILGAALAVSGAAFAADTGGPKRFHDRANHHGSLHYGHAAFHKGHAHAFHRGGKGMHYQARLHRAGLIVPGYGIVSRDFVDGMGLNENQLELVDAARKAAQDLRESRRDHIKAEREARRDRFKAASLDPEQALQQADERREKARAERREIDDKWVAVWHSLDTDQQARVADHLKQRTERAQKRAEKRQERKQKRAEAKADS